MMATDGSWKKSKHLVRVDLSLSFFSGKKAAVTHTQINIIPTFVHEWPHLSVNLQLPWFSNGMTSWFMRCVISWAPFVFPFLCDEQEKLEGRW